jgi:peptide subunit release factor RF-3
MKSPALRHAAGPELRFPPIPSFSPELFSYMRCAPNQKKAFAKGVEGLLGEGAVQVGWWRSVVFHDLRLHAFT